ncbi:MAG: DEAD/DEAH box helicase family protein [Clostridia bacterium]|nr:DEAD/DEAH box helicase family protein [Clostridia bacterium]
MANNQFGNAKNTIEADFLSVIEDFDLEVTNEAYDMEMQRANVSDEPVEYTSEVANMNKVVVELDRYDDFAALKIKPKDYEAETEDGYGIHLREGQLEPIYTHQKEAARRFLSEHRGFGMLADVVGSGKTFEAGVVLSELAIRGCIRSMLVVAPEQVYSAWIEVLESYFGLGKGVLNELDANPNWRELTKVQGNFRYLAKPCIVKMEDFVRWDRAQTNILFDVIVVDEAHHLCDSEGEFIGAMELLSYLMKIKKDANKKYCLLLTATPHSGNLENMFNLWYFIRCEGGKSEDFRPETLTHSEEYLREKRYYKDHICRGATTVMEFINKVKIQEVEENDAYLKELLNYLKVSFAQYSGLTEAERLERISQFLREHDEIAANVRKRVASAYHNGVLRPIMVRQANNGLAKKKSAINYLFYPTESNDKVVTLQNEKRNGLIQVDVENLNNNQAIEVDGKKLSLRAYIKSYESGVLDESVTRDHITQFITDKFFNGIGVKPELFKKVGSLGYYKGQLLEMPLNVSNEFYPVRLGNKQKCIDAKLEKLKELLRLNMNSRVIVFFDYDKKRSAETVEKVEKALREEADLSERLLLGVSTNQREIESEFETDKWDNGILLVKEAAFTEGINLQSANIIINFEVSPDPLAMDQRIGRAFRLGQKHDVVIYSFADMCKLEGYALMYFSGIGLITSSGGDATILAGSNNERMVTIRCPSCGRVELRSQEEYEKWRFEDSDNLYCTNRKCRMDNIRGTLMNEISVYNFKCDKNEAHVFTRSVADEGYFCVSSSDIQQGMMQETAMRSSMCSHGNKKDRSFYCRKICALAHCEFFTRGDMAGQCKALEEYNKNKNIDDAELMCYCETCPHQQLCKTRGCMVGVGADSIKKCGDCRFSMCNPKPHEIVFNDKWEAKCPKCTGKIRPIMARTFATYIRGAWDYQFDGGEAFCRNLGNERAHIAEIKEILEKDEEQR